MYEYPTDAMLFNFRSYPSRVPHSTKQNQPSPFPKKKMPSSGAPPPHHLTNYLSPPAPAR